LKRAAHYHWIANIPNHQLNRRIEIMRSPPFRPMNLCGYQIEGTDAVTMTQQLICQVRANKPRSAGNEDMFTHM
jgi:hypothetical protein